MGHLDASIDPEQLAVWFTLDHPDAVVGVYTGKSELLVLDIDVDEYKDGFGSLGFLEIPETYSYFTQSKTGKHFWYELSDQLPPSNKYRGMEGIDRKSGSSYVIAWSDDLPASRDEFAMPPGWLLDYTEPHEVSGFDGDVDGWLDSIPQGEPTETVKSIIDNLPLDNFGHETVISITYRLVRLASEGHTGVGWALDELYRTWVKPPYDKPEHKRELSNAIIGAIRKAGDEDISIKNLPPYASVIDRASGKLLDMLTSPESGKRGYFAAIKQAVSEGIADNEIASMIWNAPATMIYARDWGIDYLHSSIATFASQALYEAGEGITPPDDDEDADTVDIHVSILTEAERKSIAHEKNFIKRYCELAATRVPKQNLPYDVINAWTVLSCALSTSGYIPRKNGKEGLNIFGMTLGDTTSGKSAARKLMLTILRDLFSRDAGFNIGGNPSPQALGKKLLERDGKVSFFNKDEAHGALKTWINADFQSGLLEALADLYDGRVDAQLRTSDWENSAKSAETHFVMHLMGTPDEMIKLLNRDMFASGFLARFVWAIGWPSEVSYESMAEEDSEVDEVKLGYDPEARQMSNELRAVAAEILHKHGRQRVPVRIDKDAAKRLQDAKWLLVKAFEKDANYDILKPSVIRLGVMARKAASLLALSEGRTTVELRDILMSLEQVEEWVANLVSITKKITASEFERYCDDVENYLKSRPDQTEKRERVIRRFRAIESFRLEQYIQSLIAQGRVREFNGTGGAKYLAVRGRGE